jgi:ABC-type nickel/cobalt efflux system permease component RcnA
MLIMNESMLATLGFGFVLGLKHATEADHLAAVSTIVSQRRSLWQSAAVGALWGMGHTASLLLAGVFVIALGIAIPERVANILELAVALMIICLGTRLLYLVLRTRRTVHVHEHTHGGQPHIHVHFHDKHHAHAIGVAHDDAHSGLSGWRPMLVGVVHGLAGSAALTLLVLSEVVRNGTAVLGFVYLLVFGIGSIGGMLIMSTLIGLPITLGVRFFQRALIPMRVLAGILSTSFGVFYAFKILEKLSAL